MGTSLEQFTGDPVITESFLHHCSIVEQRLIELSCKQVVVLIPEIGLSYGPGATVSKCGYPFIQMELEWLLSNGTNTFARRIIQRLTKPHNTRVNLTRRPEFEYDIRPKKNVTVGRVVANIDTLDLQIKKLMLEANRVYYTYCIDLL